MQGFTSRRTRVAFLASVAALCLAGSAQADPGQSLTNVSLSNIRFQPNQASALTNSGSVSATRIQANTAVSSTFGPGVNLNPAGNGGLGGVTAGFAETTQLSGGANAYNSKSLTGAGTVQGSYATQQQSGILSPTGHSQMGTSTALSANGRLDGAFTVGAASNAITGMQGYSGSQLNGPGSVSNSVSGNALVASGAVTGGAMLSGRSGAH
jgi:hypothetical protein